MEFFIKKIFEGRPDDLVHLQFKKFSRGEFSARAMVRVKNSGGKFNIATTSEYAREFIINLGEKLGGERVLVTGALISALKLEGFDYKEKKSAIGINKYFIEKEMSGNELVELCEKFPKAFLGLSFKVGDSELKIQTKSPKSSKGASSQKKEGEKLKIDFCKLKTNDKELVRGLIFEDELAGLNFKNVEISQDFIIDEIVITDEMKEKCGRDFGELREMALRKGRVVRKLNVDGREVVKEKEFEV